MIAWRSPEPASGEPERVGPVDLMMVILFPWIEPPAEITEPLVIGPCDRYCEPREAEAGQ